ncbi:DUF917 domain-containing protein [Robiginitomaculum antarcticum]|uniref:DUF917 domain-containing protein n=1 Tax=Robiginitomaculum antarcticum TaxID=437507 RepID=UPI000369F63C|nr:DUF917 domain-containing protein [Robiginitomaculum antarcticum]
MKTIGLEHLDDIALGSVFLATGGGGDPHVPKLIAREAIKKYGPVALIQPEDLADDAYVVPIGSVGAPTVSLELLPSIDDAALTIDAFEKYVGRKIDAVASFEIGGGNSLIPLVAAAGKGIPVVDGDGMGRALPEAQMMSYAIAGVKPTPAVAYDYAGNTATFEVSTTDIYERHIRSYSMAAGGMITAAEHPMTGAELKRSVIPGTLSFSVELGRTLRENRGQADSLLKPLQDVFAKSIYGECRIICTGKVIDKATRIIGGYDIGEATIEAFDGIGENLSVNIKNEYLLARIGDKVVASVPDLITIVDFETGAPINAERLRYGQRVCVFATGCPEFYRSKAALKVVAPRCFGFNIDYVPLEDL